jgi:hypothetical protein
MTNPAEDGPAGLAMPKPTDPISSRTLYIEADLDHGAAGHDQAGQDLVSADPKAAIHDLSRLLLIRL